MEPEAVIRYVAGVFLVAVAALVLATVKRDTRPAILREAAKNALYIYGGAAVVGLAAYLICLFK